MAIPKGVTTFQSVSIAKLNSYAYFHYTIYILNCSRFNVSCIAMYGAINKFNMRYKLQSAHESL
jgi:hypothetical protein